MPSTLALLAAFLVPVAVHAGSAANVQACIWLSQVPTAAYTINWNVGSASDQCLYDAGTTPEPMAVGTTTSGLVCTSVGYVYAKASSSGGDLCATDESIWSLSYTGGKDNIYSGSTSSLWESSGIFLSNAHVTLRSSSASTFICANEVHCPDTDLWWSISNTPTIYIVFTPTSTALDFETPQQIQLLDEL